jgi:hypothetical protein
MSGKVTLQHIETGETRKFHSIDAKELSANVWVTPEQVGTLGNVNANVQTTANKRGRKAKQ